jgi:uncharacterized protein YodC (DUF2158 family)
MSDAARSGLGVGSVVRLKSGGPLMTIDEISEYEVEEIDGIQEESDALGATVVWIDAAGKAHRAEYDLRCLVPAAPPAS